MSGSVVYGTSAQVAIPWKLEPLHSEFCGLKQPCRPYIRHANK